MQKEKIAYKASIISIIGNIFLSLFKLISGIIGHSISMISDAIHSISDVFSTIVVMIGIKISSKDIDENHPYGHERFECVASLILSVMLFYIGITIGYKGINNIITGSYKTLKIPTLLPLIAAIISIIIKFIMFIYTKICAIKINSNALLADSYHHLSDSLSSIGSLIGIILAISGYPIFDSIASIIICIFIIKISIDIFKDTIDQIVDKSCNKELIEKFKTEILNNKEVKNIDMLKTRMFGNKIYIDIEIAVDKKLSLIKAHNIAENIHNNLENKYKDLKHCMIHVNPYGENHER